MKKLLSISVIFLLIFSGITFSIPKAADTIHKTKEFSITISNHSFTSTDNRAQINIPETNTYTQQPGKPRLPLIEKTFTFPVNTKITEISYTTEDIIEEPIDYTLKLTPIPVPLSSSQTYVDEEQSNSFYTTPHPYPTSWLTYDIGRGIIEGEASIIVKIHAYPIQYYPNQHMIKKAQTMNIQVQYQQMPSHQHEKTFDEDYKLIILSPSEFTDNLQPLITHKLSRNISTKLVTLDEVYNGIYFQSEGEDSQEQIKHFIKNVYENWETQYVLLIGGRDHFPYRECHVYIGYHDDSEIIVSDLYYADLYDENNTFQTWDTNGNGRYAEYNWSEAFDNLDLYPDIYLGRLACTEREEVDVVVDKIIQYENQKSYQKSWFKNLILIGGDSFTPVHGDESGVNEGELANQHVLDTMQGFIGTKLWASNAKLMGVNPSGVDRIMDSIEEGCGFVHFSGHGGVTVWTTYPHNGTKQSLPTPTGRFRIDHIQRLENGYSLPIVVTGACSVGKFQKNDNCFSWSFVSNPDGGGIASFGATGLGYAALGANVTEAVVEKMALEMFKAYKNEEAKTVGEMWATAITNYITPTLYSTDYKTIEEWQPFCDPSLALRQEYLTPSQPPETPQLTGPITGKPGMTYTYNATTTDPDRNQVSYLFDWGDGSFSEWIGPVNSGVTVSKSHRWDEKANFTVRVKAKDENNYESNWSEPITISLPKNKGIIDDNPLLHFLKNFFHFSCLHKLFPLLLT